MNILYKNRKNNWCLFLVHLVIEKLLKALYANKNNPYIPKSDDLVYLVNKLEINIPKNIKKH